MQNVQVLKSALKNSTQVNTPDQNKKKTVWFCIHDSVTDNPSPKYRKKRVEHKPVIVQLDDSDDSVSDDGEPLF